MATTTYAGSASGIVYGGGVPDGSQLNTPNNFGGEFIQQRVGSNAEIRVNFTGTQCELRIYADGNPWTWTIDGGSNQTASPSGNNMQWLTVATALSDTTHTLVVKPVGTFAGWDSLLRVTGASPAISAPTGYTNPQFGFTSSGVTRDNSAYRTSAVEGYVGLTDHGSCRFKATTSSIKIWNRYDLNNPIGLVVDDDITTLVRVSPSSGWGWTEFSGLDGSAEHSYRFIIPYGVYFYNFMAAGLNTASLTPYPADYWMGDSITANTTITNGDTAPSYWTYYAIKAKRGWQIQALGGATAATQGVAWKTYPGLASPTPDRVIVAFGTNDLGNAESSATWTSAVTTLITQVNSDLPTKKVIWLGIFDTTFTHANRGTYNTDLSNTIAAYGNSLVTYFSSDGAGLITTSDSVHFDASGSATYGNYLVSNLDPPTGYTLTVAQGSISLSGQSVNLLAARTLPVAQGSVTLTAEPANLLASRVQVVDQGTVSLSAQSVNLLAARSLPVAQGSVALTGQTVNLLSARTLTVDQGSVALTGQAVTLTYSGSGSKTLTVDQGTISLSAQAVNLVANRTLAVTQGSVALTGQTVNLVAARTLTVDQGSVALTGQAVTLTYSGSGAKILTVDQGTISLSGQAVNLVYSGGAKVLAVDQDTITLSAQSANLLASRKIAVDQGAITVTAYNVNLTYSGAPVSRAVIAIRCLNGNRWVRAARTPGG